MMCALLLKHIDNDTEYMKNVIMEDDSWVFEYDPETKRQSKAWHTKNVAMPPFPNHETANPRSNQY